MTLLTDLTITLMGYLILAISYLGLGWAGSRILRIDFPVKRNRFSNMVRLGYYTFPAADTKFIFSYQPVL